MSEVTDLLNKLRAGTLPLDKVAEAFKTRKWPKGPAKHTTYEALATADMGDPEPAVEGSFDEVSAAYALGQITDKQYAVLAKAAAAASPKKEESGRAKK